MSLINKYIKENASSKSTDLDGWQVCPMIHCNDGFSFSVQASEYHYSVPRKAKAFHYKAVEVGFPSKKESLLVDFVEPSFQDGEKIRWTKTVYPYVPVEVVNNIILKHGGIKEDI